MKQRIYKLLCLMTALFIMSCECPYLYGESDSEYYRRTGIVGQATTGSQPICCQASGSAITP